MYKRQLPRIAHFRPGLDPDHGRTNAVGHVDYGIGIGIQQRPIIDLRSVSPVSYTHLDVYKRQLPRIAHFRPGLDPDHGRTNAVGHVDYGIGIGIQQRPIIDLRSVSPVSYTHLDVYKRQLPRIAHFRPGLDPDHGRTNAVGHVDYGIGIGIQQRPIIDLRSVSPVSYTHLDVYKRQLPRIAHFRPGLDPDHGRTNAVGHVDYGIGIGIQQRPIIDLRSVSPVSYTHLDVYKRQLPRIAHFRPGLDPDHGRTNAVGHVDYGIGIGIQQRPIIDLRSVSPVSYTHLDVYKRQLPRIAHFRPGLDPDHGRTNAVGHVDYGIGIGIQQRPIIDLRSVSPVSYTHLDVYKRQLPRIAHFRPGLDPDHGRTNAVGHVDYGIGIGIQQRPIIDLRSVSPVSYTHLDVYKRQLPRIAHFRPGLDPDHGRTNAVGHVDYGIGIGIQQRPIIDLRSVSPVSYTHLDVYKRQLPRIAHFRPGLDPDHGRTNAVGHVDYGIGIGIQQRPIIDLRSVSPVSYTHLDVYKRQLPRIAHFRPGLDPDHGRTNAVGHVDYGIGIGIQQRPIIDLRSVSPVSYTHLDVYKRQLPRIAHFRPGLDPDHGRTNAVGHVDYGIGIGIQQRPIIDLRSVSPVSYTHLDVYKRQLPRIAHFRPGLDPDHGRTNAVGHVDYGIGIGIQQRPIIDLRSVSPVSYTHLDVYKRQLPRIAHFRPGLDPDHGRTNAVGHVDYGIGIGIQQRPIIDLRSVSPVSYTHLDVYKRQLPRIAHFRPGLDPDHGRTNAVGHVDYGIGIGIQQRPIIDLRSVSPVSYTHLDVYKRQLPRIAHFRPGLDPDHGRTNAVGHVDYGIGIGIQQRPIIDLRSVSPVSYTHLDVYKRQLPRIAHFRPGLDPDHGRTNAVGHVDYGIGIGIQQRPIIDLRSVSPVSYTHLDVYKRQLPRIAHFRPGLDPDHGRTNAVGHVDYGIGIGIQQRPIIDLRSVSPVSYTHLDVYKRQLPRIAHFRPGLDPDHGRTNAVGHVDYGIGIGIQQRPIIDLRSVSPVSYTHLDVYKRQLPRIAHFRPGLDPDHGRTNAVGHVDYGIGIGIQQRPIIDLRSVSPVSYTHLDVYKRQLPRIAHFRPGLDPDHGRTNAVGHVDYGIGIGIQQRPIIDLRSVSPVSYTHLDVYKRQLPRIAHFRPGLDPDHGRTNAVGHVDYGIGIGIQQRPIIDLRSVSPVSYTHLDVYKRQLPRIAHFRPGLDPDHGRTNAVGHVDYGIGIGIQQRPIIDLRSVSPVSYTHLDVYKRQLPRIAHFRPGLDPDHGRTNAVGHVDYGIGIGIQQRPIIDLRSVSPVSYTHLDVYKRQLPRIAHFRPGLDPDHGRTNAVGHVDYGIGIGIQQRPIIDLRSVSPVSYTHLDVYKRQLPRIAHFRPGLDPDHGRTNAVGHVDYGIGIGIQQRPIIDLRSVSPVSYTHLDVYKRQLPRIAHFRPGLDPDHGRTNAVGHVDYGIGIGIQQRPIIDLRSVSPVSYTHLDVYKRQLPRIAHFRPGLDPDHGRTNAVGHVDYGIGIGIQQRPIIDLRSVSPVSYTHLDVYKRQLPRIAHFRPGLDPDHGRTNAVGHVDYGIGIGIQQRPIIDLRSVSPVSYTHLDVYKRQLPRIAHFRPGLDPDHGRTNAVGHVDYGIGIGIQQRPIIDLRSVSPVSYTHLDVYKRQLPRIAHFRPGLDPDHGRTNAVGHVDYGIGIGIQQRPIIDLRSVSRSR